MQTRVDEAATSTPAIRAELERILASADFRASARLRTFLSFVVEETLAGRKHGIKAYSVAVAVLGRGEDFDPDTDPIVRVEAGRLRKGLEHYYLTGGSKDPLQIEIPKGSYVPVFREAQSDPDAPSRTHRLPRLAILPTLSTEPGPGSRMAGILGTQLAVAFGRLGNLKVSAPPAESDAAAQREYLRRLELDPQVRFSLVGNVQDLGADLRISLQLWDRSAGEQIWAEHYDSTLVGRGGFERLDEITRRVVAQVGDFNGGAIPRVLTRELLRSKRDANGYGTVLLVDHYTSVAGSEEYLQARRSLEQAVDLAPDSAELRAQLAGIHADGYSHHFVEGDREQIVGQAMAEIRKAIALDPSSESCFWNLAAIRLAARDAAGARDAAEHLIEVSVTPSTMAFGGWLLALTGDWERGLSMLSEHLPLLSHYPGWFHHAPFLDFYRQGSYAQALREASQLRMPQFLWDPLDRAAALAQLGRDDEASCALRDAVELRPLLARDPRRYLDCFILQDDLLEHVLDGLHKAGLSELALERADQA